jgi:hypothetical protein
MQENPDRARSFLIAGRIALSGRLSGRIDARAVEEASRQNTRRDSIFGRPYKYVVAKVPA